MRIFVSLSLLCAAVILADAADQEELKVKREAVFEFVKPPAVTRNGDRIEVTFETKGFCDVTVAVEEASGKIVRHLASGVLGGNAPPPFAKNAKAQTLLWDGKNDQGKYIDDKDRLTLRVSLGLDPTFEKSLYDDPKMRHSREPVLLCPAPEGMYVYDGGEAMDYLRLYDHDGNYLRTIYPFPANQVANVKDLHWHEYPGGARLPVKENFLQNTLLTSGTNSFGLDCYKEAEKRYDSALTYSGYHYGQDGRGAMALTVRGTRIALASVLLNRLSTDGSSGGLSLTGPRTDAEVEPKLGIFRGEKMNFPPHSLAFAPDGKTLYLAGYNFSYKGKAAADIVTNAGWDAVHGVFKLDFEGASPPAMFAGNREIGVSGTDERHFRAPLAVAVDQQANVYVADYMNDRVQVFAPDAKFLRSVSVKRPAQIFLDENANQMIVFSYPVYNEFNFKKPEAVPLTMIRMGPLASPKVLESIALPQLHTSANIENFYFGDGFTVQAAYDPWAKPPRIWVSEEFQHENAMTRQKKVNSNVRLYAVKNGKAELVRDFLKDLEESMARTVAPKRFRQRLNVNPLTGKLFVGEGDSYVYNAHKQMVEVDPESGKARLVELPFDAEDLCFDAEGHIYLRTHTVVGRYEAATWREVPWDYGEERSKVATSSSNDRREGPLLSGLVLPASSSWHHGGMFVDLKGNLAVSCLFWSMNPSRLSDQFQGETVSGRPYQAFMFPGRVLDGRGGGVYLHVWDKHGRVIVDDGLPGIADDTYGVGLDEHGDLYVLAAATRMLDGKLHFNDMTGTLIKVKPKKSKVISASDKVSVPLPATDRPNRPFELSNAIQGNAWIEPPADWLYGGVGWCGKNRGIGCACTNCRFAFDYFARSFAPEMDRCSVAVLDSAGNLILHIGKYGNADSAGPESKVPLGGDEVGLVFGAYLATHTDKRLFIADPGNGRILSVKLGYHANEKIALKGVPEVGK